MNTHVVLDHTGCGILTRIAASSTLQTLVRFNVSRYVVIVVVIGFDVGSIEGFGHGVYIWEVIARITRAKV